jgi:DNA-binding PadR family transcriptional regulator
MARAATPIARPAGPTSVRPGSRYGYELRGEFRDAIGPQWGDLNIGHLYQILDRLVRDGLATKHEIPQDNRPDK